MTIRAMLSLVAIGVTSLSLAACGRPGTLSEEQADELKAAQNEAAEATDEVADVSAELAALQRRFDKVESDAREAATGTGHLRKRLDGIGERLRNGLDGLRSALADAESSSASASSDAASALSEVRGAAQDLSVLRTRYDEHLRRFHGGG